jgi:protein SCO1
VRRRLELLRGGRGAVTLVVAAAVSSAAVAGGLAVADRSPAPPPLAIGAELSPPKPVPSIPLVAADRRRVTLRSYRGKVVVLAPFLSLCAEQCPITTGAFMQAARQVAAAGLGRKVVFIEATVDPWRDTPARLRAFQHLIHDRRVVMLTGTRSHVRAFWRFFGVWYRRVPEDTPADTDWWTHTPQRFDVQHTDAIIIIDAVGRWRVADLGTADTDGRLGSRLRSLLDTDGLQNLRSPRAAWTVPELLQDVAHARGRSGP